MPHARRAATILVLVLLAGCARPGRDVDAPGPGSAEAGARLWVVLPSIAEVGEPVRVHVAPLDSLGTPAARWSGTLALTSTDPAMITTGPFVAGDGSLSAPVTFRTPGIHRVTVTSTAGETARGGPVRVVTTTEDLAARPGEASRRLLWGDAHGHTDVGDGANPPLQFLFYGRDVAHLDWICVSEHDFQQFLDVGLDVEEGSWDRIAALAREWRRPDFAVLLGWEWSSREHGHRVVFFPDDASRYVSYRGTPTPSGLAEALRGTGALSVIAHPTGSELTPKVAWESVVPGFDRVIEIYSGHGCMDETDYRPTSDPSPGHSALDALRRHLPLAFAGFSDTHLSTPGNPWPPPIRDAPYRGGLTAVWTEGTSERDVLEALRAGRCYATSGERFYVELRVGDRSLGETLVAASGEPVRVRGLAAAAGSIAWTEILVDDRPVLRRDGGGPEVEITTEVGPFDGEAAVWMRGASVEGERFWTTPVRVVRP